MLGLGLSLGRGASATVYELEREYVSDFSSGTDSWDALSDNPAVTPVGASTLDGVSDVLLYTLADTTILALKSGFINSFSDDNKRVVITADVYLESTTGNGTLRHIVGNFTNNEIEVSVPNNVWTPITIVIPDIGNIGGGNFGFKTTGSNLSVDDKLGIKNYVLKVFI